MEKEDSEKKIDWDDKSIDYLTKLMEDLRIGYKETYSSCELNPNWVIWKSHINDIVI